MDILRRISRDYFQKTAGIKEGDALVGPLRQEFAADDFGIEFRAPVDVADRDAEMRDALDFRHDLVLF